MQLAQPSTPGQKQKESVVGQRRHLGNLVDVGQHLFFDAHLLKDIGHPDTSKESANVSWSEFWTKSTGWRGLAEII